MSCTYSKAIKIFSPKSPKTISKMEIPLSHTIHMITYSLVILKKNKVVTSTLTKHRFLSRYKKDLFIAQMQKSCDGNQQFLRTL